MTLYLKYRAKNVDELDIESVRESLFRIFRSGSVPHAFLFSGPKGTGKTSAARILAKIILCENLNKDGITPCEKCEQCLSIIRGNNIDVLEIDAASHRGIDDVRVLRDGVRLSPIKAKKKIYIIDEAHMLTAEASNALLKTLEEPPSHVIFILATTNPEKLIPTIRSRTTNILFTKADIGEIVRCLSRIVKNEEKKIDDKILELLAKLADGSFRDAIKNLELLLSQDGEITLESAEKIFSKQAHFSALSFLQNMASVKSAKESLEFIEKAKDGGVLMNDFIKEIFSELKESLLAKNGIGKDRLDLLTENDLIGFMECLSNSIDNVFSGIDELPLEVAVVKWLGAQDTKEKQIKSKNDPGNKEAVRNDSSAENKVDVISEKTERLEKPQEGQKAETHIDKKAGQIKDEFWKNILSEMRQKNTSIETLLRTSKPLNFDGETLTLGVYYKFHKERLEENKHRSVLEEIAGRVLTSPVRIVCTLVEPPERVISEFIPKEVVLTEPKEESVNSLNNPDDGKTLTDDKSEDIISAAKEIFGN